MIITVTLNPALDKTLRIRNFEVGQHAQAEVLSLTAAGKGINVSRGLARLGQNSVACGLVGRGEMEAFEGILAEDAVEAKLTQVSGVTRTNTTILDPERSTTTHLRERGGVVKAGDLERMGDRLQGLIAGGEQPRVIFTGSLPPGVSPPDYVRLLSRCERAGASVVVDTSGPALQQAVRSGVVHTVKPNRTELGQCLAADLRSKGPVEAARELLPFLTTILLTMGEDGAFLLTHGAERGAMCRLKPEELNNTVGCGDAFLSGWLDATERGELPGDALRWAVAAGAASARGETAVDYSRSDVEELAGRSETP